MTDNVHDALIRAVLTANEVVVDAEKQTQRWARNRSYLAAVAHVNGVPMEELAAKLGEPLSTIREWVEPSEA